MNVASQDATDSSIETSVVNNVYTIGITMDKGLYSYTICYSYYRLLSFLEISTKITKSGVLSEYNEIITILLNAKCVFKDIVSKTPNTTGGYDYTWNEEVLRVLDYNGSLTSYIDSYHLGGAVKYTTKNADSGNEYKAFYIDGTDIKSQYWNKTAYVHSAMLCPSETCINGESLVVSDYSEYIPLVNNITLNGRTDPVIIYNYTGGFTRYYDKFIITPDSINLYDDDNKLVSSAILSLFVNENEKITCSSEPGEIMNLTETQTKEGTYVVMNDKQKKYYKVLLTVQGDNITTITLYGISSIFNPSSLDEWTLLGTHVGAVVPEQPIYLFYDTEGFEIIIGATTDFANFPTTKTLTVNSITVSRTKYLTTHYYVDREDNCVKYKAIDTIRYSNIPGDYCDESDVLFTVLGQEGMIFKLNPIFKYYENIIVSPRHVDQNNNFIMLAQKYNQNVLAKPVYLRSQYNLNNPNQNTLRDQTEVDYKIAQRLDPTKTHLLESVNKSMIMLGSVENNGPIGEVAIRAQKIHAIPTASKMLLSIEFS